MKFNKKIAKSILIIFAIIATTIAQVAYLSLYNGYINNINHYDNKDLFENHKEDDFSPHTSSNTPPNANYFKFYKIITIDYTKVFGTESHINFTLLISILDADLHDKVQSDGDDIAFSNGTDWLDHEIESFDKNYGTRYAKLVAWVRIPILSNLKDTIIYMYYGNSTMTSRQNSTAVWPGYCAVYHMNQDPSTYKILDSTANDYDLTPGTGFTSGDLIDGHFGKAIDFDGVNTQYLELSSGFSNPTSNLTFEMWFKPQVRDTYQYYFRGNSVPNEYPKINYQSSNEMRTVIETSAGAGGTSSNFIGWQTDQWYHLVTDWERSIGRVKIYINSTLDYDDEDPENYGTIIPWTGFTIGSDIDHTDPVNGIIEEFRIYSDRRSANWIKTEYYNQYDSDSFYSVSGRYEVNPPKPKDFNFYKVITIDHNKVSGSHKGFPLLISILDTDLRDQVQSDGDDIVFYNGTIWLQHEIEYFNQTYNPSFAKLVVWVRIPYLSGSVDTIIYMYYGNSSMTSRQDPSGVWDNNYKGVWHLSEVPTGASDEIRDSTAINDGTSYGSMSSDNQITGQIDGSLDFDGSNDYISCGDTEDITDAITIEAWVWLAVATKPDWPTIVGKSSEYRLYHDSDHDGYITFFVSTTSGYRYTGEFDLPIQTWLYVVGTYDGSSSKIYIDGSVENTDSHTGTIVPTTNDLRFARKAGSTYFDGSIDEVRISNIDRSADWIATCYENQNDPNNFYSISGAIKTYIPSFEDFAYYKEITIDHTKVSGTGSHMNFPVLISILDEDLHDDVQVDGDDIAFSNGTEWIDHEIEVFKRNYDSTRAQLIAWVRVPSLSASTNTKIYIYYGNSTICSQENPTCVWDSTYKGVWHLLEANGDNYAEDSTSYNEFGNIGGTTTQGSNGQINSAYDFGTDGTVIVDDPVDGHLDFSGTQSFTISFWINIDASTEIWQLPLYKGGEMSQIEGYNFETSPNGQSLTFYICDGNIGGNDRVGSSAALVFPFDAWYYITGVVNRTSQSIHMYKDGSEVGSGTDISAIGSLSNTYDLQFPWADYELNGLLDEVRISNVDRSSDWITTEYNNQYNPGSFYSVGPEQTGFSTIQVNVIDSYDNPIPNVNVTILNSTEIKYSVITNNDGYALFTNIPQSAIDGYNFTVNMTSNIEPFRTITINRTSEAIKIEDPFHNITLICNASRNIFTVEDVDGISLDSGWIIVSKGTQELQNCTIDATGHATFWWLNTTGYSYMLWYKDIVYDPNPILLKSDVISAPNLPIPLTVNLTTANFTVWTDDHSQVVSGVKLMFYNTSSWANIVNFTTNMNGKATFRWLTTNNEYNYSLNVTFYGQHKQIKIYGIGSFVDRLELEITTAISYDIDMQITSSVLEEFETEIILLMSDSIVKPWGTTITLRALFNVTKTGGLKPVGPTYADSMTYKIYEGSMLILSDTIPKETDYMGRHQWIFKTTTLDVNILYTIIIEASKEEYVVPSEKYLSLYLLENEIMLNQSENNDSEQIVYWLDNPNMSVTPYGEITEEYIVEQSIFQSVDHNFKFSIPDISNSWNLSEITFNIYNITWTGAESDINIIIKDPYGDLTNYTKSNHSGWDIDGHKWIGITYTLEKGSPVGDNSFNFTIGGSFSGTVDIITDIYFIRDKINIEYKQFNITDSISLLSDGNGWAIKNITFNLYNCRNPSDWSEIDPANAISKISTNEGYNYTFISSGPGFGIIIIDNITVYPLDGQFLFEIIKSNDIMFDVNITVEFIQGFYRNEYLETINSSETFHNIYKNSEIQISVVEYSWIDNNAVLFINDIWNGTDYFLPSDVEMNITINGITYTDISDVKGNGEFSLNGFNKDQIYTAMIGTNQDVNFTLLFEIIYSRMAVYKILGIVTYSILGTDIINQPVQYYENSGCYIQTINTSLIDANVYSPYTIRFTCSKDNYISDSIDLDLRVLERLTLLGYAGTNKTGFYIISSSLYVEDSKIYTFFYIDYEYGKDIQDLNSQSYDWKYYNTEGQLVDSGSGDLTSNANNEYVLDINTEILAIGRYEIWISLEKQNYESKQTIIILTVNEREINYDLGDMFEDKQTSVVKGETITLSIELTDPTKGDIPLKDAKVILEIGDEELEFEEVEDGVYEVEFETDDYEAFFASNTITGTIKIYKANYTSEDTDITIVIEMEEVEVIPGFLRVPIFYLLLLIMAIGAVVGSLGTYKYIQLMKIPEFVKRLRSMKKLIKTNDNIDNSLLYPSKEMYMAHLIKDKWEIIGISLEAILGMQIQKVEEVVKAKPRIVVAERRSDLIPKGLILMRWNERVGTEVMVQYPEGIEITKKTLMQIYGTHEYTGESGVVNLMAGNSNILSYYTGAEKGYYLVLILHLDDDPDLYEDAMADILRTIFQNLEGDSYLQIISSLFQRLSMFPNLTAEGRIAYLYQDEIKRMIINRLREEGVISKSELAVWLKDQYKEGFFDIESILAELIKMEIIKESSIKGIPSELIFLINDIFMIRVPPIEFLKNPEAHGLPSQLTKTYSNEINKFFQNYRPSEEDHVKVIETISDPQVFETLRLLRTAIVTRNDLEKLRKKGVSDINAALKQLWQANLITVLQDKTGTEYYALLSDFNLNLIFPKYLLKIIKNGYDQKSKGDNVLIEYLNILEDTYLNLKSREKSEE